MSIRVRAFIRIASVLRKGFAVVAAFCGLKLPFRIRESSEAGAYSLRVHVPK